MTRTVVSVACLALLTISRAVGQVTSYEPVTDARLLDPDPADWLMFSRTYDNQRFSPLDQINRDNVSQLERVWSHDMHPGTQENIPLVHDGVMFVANPKGIIQALAAADGKLLWEHRRSLPGDCLLGFRYHKDFTKFVDDP